MSKKARARMALVVAAGAGCLPALAACEALLDVGSLTERHATSDASAGDGMPSSKPDAGTDAHGADVGDAIAPDATSVADGPAADTSTCTDTCNGICTDTTQDPHNCGSCNHDCDALPHVTGLGVTCASGVCDVPPSGCAPGYAHCSSVPDDGCETNITQPATCGGCATSCTSGAPVCETNGDGGYGCVTGCTGSTPTLCGGTCTNTTNDPNHCGTCSMACPSPDGGGIATCASNACGVQCNGGYHQCGPACALDSDPTQCGTSCTFCSVPASNGSATCTGGQCGVACSSGYHQCGTSATCASDTDATQCGPGCVSCPTPSNGGQAICTGGQCGASCTLPYSACNDDCVDYQTDGKNCGTCGHSCNGTTCTGGACQPVTLASGGQPNQIAVDGTNVYWTDSGVSAALSSCAKTGCSMAPTTIVAGTYLAQGIAVDSTYVYWSDEHKGISRCLLPVCSGGQEPIVDDSSYNIAIDTSSVFFGAGGVASCPLGGCDAGAPIGSGASATVGIVTDGAFVYFNAGGIYKCPVSGCGATTPLYASPGYMGSNSYGAIALSGNQLYWTDATGAIYTCSSQSCAGATKLYGGSPPVTQLFADATGVYWTSAGAFGGATGSVAACPPTTCTMPTLYQSENLAYPAGIATDADFIYWVNTGTSAGGSVMKISK